MKVYKSARLHHLLCLRASLCPSVRVCVRVHDLPACAASVSIPCHRIVLRPQAHDSTGAGNGVDGGCGEQGLGAMAASECYLWLCDKRLLVLHPDALLWVSCYRSESSNSRALLWVSFVLTSFLPLNNIRWTLLIHYVCVTNCHWIGVHGVHTLPFYLWAPITKHTQGVCNLSAGGALVQLWTLCNLQLYCFWSLNSDHIFTFQEY